MKWKTQEQNRMLLASVDTRLETLELVMAFEAKFHKDNVSTFPYMSSLSVKVVIIFIIIVL